jgi:hypothetical protein
LVRYFAAFLKQSDRCSGGNNYMAFRRRRATSPCGVWRAELMVRCNGLSVGPNTFNAAAILSDRPEIKLTGPADERPGFVYALGCRLRKPSILRVVGALLGNLVVPAIPLPPDRKRAGGAARRAVAGSAGERKRSGWYRAARPPSTSSLTALSPTSEIRNQARLSGADGDQPASQSDQARQGPP